MKKGAALFGKFKNSLCKDSFWSIKASEYKHFFYMSALMFCVLFNQSVLRILKDSILIAEVSAEITNFAKVYCVTPAATIFFVIYAKMVNRLSFVEIFTYLIFFFLAFFIIFSWIIYPNTDFWHLDKEKMQNLALLYPNLKWYIALGENWSYVVFYVLAELWPNIFYILLFWQLANQITSTEQAKRFYIRFSLFGNSAVVIVGILMMSISSEKSFIYRYCDVSSNKIMLVQCSMLFVILFSLLSILLVRFIFKTVVIQEDPKTIPSKPSLTFGQSFKYIVSSKYLWLLLICSASFGLTMNLVEAVWKAKIKQLYPTVNNYAEFNALYIMWTGIAIMFMTIVGNSVMKHQSWFVTAVITPIIIMTTGVVFFTLIVFEDYMVPMVDKIMLTSPLVLAVSIGAIQNIIVKGTKYSLWDTSREMLYIPLDKELKTKGKAAVDVISSKIGKSSSGLIQSILFTIFPAATAISIAPGMMVIFVIACIAWIYAVQIIYQEYKKIIS
jgi:AAA family ATP:ADP antiporter